MGVMIILLILSLLYTKIRQLIDDNVTMGIIIIIIMMIFIMVIVLIVDVIIIIIIIILVIIMGPLARRACAGEVMLACEIKGRK